MARQDELERGEHPIPNGAIRRVSDLNEAIQSLDATTEMQEFEAMIRTSEMRQLDTEGNQIIAQNETVAETVMLDPTLSPDVNRLSEVASKLAQPGSGVVDA